MDAWKGWQVTSFGEQEIKFIPGDCLRNTIEQFGVREIVVSASPDRMRPVPY
jgi:hypothetical protein